jgi:RNA polymerase sigma-70 factor, ECF subfamily
MLLTDTDETELFAAQLERHRREIHVHCYRMLGSFQDAEDLTQETFLRAWHRRSTFQGRATFRAWLYKIATNACLDTLGHSSRRLVDAGGGAEVPWLQPYPDELLDTIPADDGDPGAAVVERETIELAFLVAVQHLPPRQRAAFIARDVLDWPARETADLLDTSVASANSLLQRARDTFRAHLPANHLPATREERLLVQRYMEASERVDADAIVELLAEDVRFSMPPEPGVFFGPGTILSCWESGRESQDVRGLVTTANRQPAIAWYRRAHGDTEYRFVALDVVRVAGTEIAEITAFFSPVDEVFRLPKTLA